MVLVLGNCEGLELFGNDLMKSNKGFLNIVILSELRIFVSQPLTTDGGKVFQKNYI